MNIKNNKTNDGCTIIIPTHNRPKYLRRILGYYTKYGEDYNIVVADSSSEENKEQNKEIILCFSNLNIRYLDNYSSKINPFHKIADALNHVNTKYCVCCADDDFITPNGINKSVDFLEKNSDFSVAQGRYINFSVRNSNKKETEQFNWMPIYSNKSIIFLDPKDRMYEHLSDYNSPTIYAVHRTNLLKMIFSETTKYTKDDRFGELLPSMLDLIYGKMKKLDVLYGARENIIDSTGRTSKDFNDFIKDKTYKRKYNKFRECLVKHLIKNSKMNSEESKILINEAMSICFKKSSSRGFKGILIGKMSNLLDALDLPESINKSIRMLYRKIVTSKYNLNKSKEIDDFEKIRNHVLLYTKNNNKNIKDAICN